MKVLERLELIDRIGRELQSRMGYGDIDTYLKAHGVDIKKPTSGVNSKWVYSKELLAGEPNSKILKIADELGVPHSHVVAEPGRTLEATFWEPLHFRLFLSHLSTFKATIGQLQAALRRYGISAFVAHVDIEPTREWQDEIVAGLHSMDALAAILMPGFKEWAAAGSVDTDLSFLSLLELYGTEIAERRMPTPRVVEALDVVEHI